MFLSFWVPHLIAMLQIKCRERKRNAISPLVALSLSPSISINVCICVWVQSVWMNSARVGLCVCVWRVQLRCCAIHVGAGGTYWPALRARMYVCEPVILSTAVIWQVQLKLFIHHPLSWKILQSFAKMRFGNQLIFRATSHLCTQQHRNYASRTL